MIARIHAEGHTFCNHTWQHLESFDDRDDAYVVWDLKATNQAILAAAPGAKIKYWRAPYANFTPRLKHFTDQLGLTPIYWDADDHCYLTSQYGRGAEMIDHMIFQVKTYTRKGSIVLSHDNLKPFTATAYDRLLPWLKARFRLIALPTD